MSMTNPSLETNETFVLQVEQAKKKQRIKSFFKGMLFLLPSIILFSVFVFYPMFKTIYLSFFLTNAKGETTVFVGLAKLLKSIYKSYFSKKHKKYFFICSVYCTI